MALDLASSKPSALCIEGPAVAQVCSRCLNGSILKKITLPLRTFDLEETERTAAILALGRLILRLVRPCLKELGL